VVLTKEQLVTLAERCQASLAKTRAELQEWSLAADEWEKTIAEVEPLTEQNRLLLGQYEYEGRAIRSKDTRGFLSRILGLPPENSNPSHEDAKRLRELPGLCQDVNKILYGYWLAFEPPEPYRSSVHGLKWFCRLRDKFNYRKIEELKKHEARVSKKLKQTLNKIAKANQAEQIQLRKREKDERTAAIAATHLGKTREHADKIKPKLVGQLAVTQCSPYCGLLLGGNRNADHIYPVCRGGQSTVENMVLICDRCNNRKSDMPLREFINKYGLDRDRIEATLEKLGKRF
jgi:5-methylcytosine-specific restriction endonuclease McrA